MSNYYNLIGVKRVLLLTYINSLAFENSCGSASSTHFAFCEAEHPTLPLPTLVITVYSALGTLPFTCFKVFSFSFFEEN